MEADREGDSDIYNISRAERNREARGSPRPDSRMPAGGERAAARSGPSRIIADLISINIPALRQAGSASLFSLCLLVHRMTIDCCSHNLVTAQHALLRRFYD